MLEVVSAYLVTDRVDASSVAFIRALQECWPLFAIRQASALVSFHIRGGFPCHSVTYA